MLCSEGEAGFLLLGGQLDVGGQAHGLESADNVPGQVKLPPLHAVPRRAGHAVVVVVPAVECALSCVNLHVSPSGQTLT